MYCFRCGKLIPDESAFCRYCGARQDLNINIDEFQEEDVRIIDPQKNVTDVTSNVHADGKVDVEIDLEDISASITEPIPSSTIFAQKIGMKYYNFIVKWQLWISMLIHFSIAINQFYPDAERVEFYTQNSFLRIYSIILGSYSILMIPVLFITRKRLKEFSPSGPIYYLIVFSLNLFSELICGLFFCIITGASLSDIISVIFCDPSFYSRLIVAAVYGIAVIRYFNKRRHLFSRFHRLL
ncbi:MAG: zinc ribbon domain-containing protein [Oscillospiraceae bacterium]|nr:zinc ribbon domain-containing protein [Oscillospiraceae bacterium]